MKFSFSSLAIGIVALACLLVDFSFKNWEKEERVIEWDVHSYYEYLPAFFIYDDIKFEKSTYRLGDNRYLFWPVYTEDGRKVIKMTMGTAYFYLPFFITAHLYAGITDYPEDGFSQPYKLFLLLSTIFYLIIGLNYLQKVLAHYRFTDKVIATVILLTGLGTNMLCYASQSAPMSHVYSFCLFALFIFYTIKWHERQSLLNTLAIGLLLGWITLIRPTNAVIVLFFLLYGITSFSELKNRIIFFFKKYLTLFLMAFCALLVWAPQLVYWKYATGHWLSYSYGEEGFFFTHPRILDGLFSWRKGWLLYTPMMIFAIAGIFFMKEELKKHRAAIVSFLLINIYIIFSWWCWWYGGTLGQRSFIESYALLAIPFASFIQFLSFQKKHFQIIFYSLAAFFIWLNIFQTYQFEFHALHHDGMSRKLYFEQFGKLDSISPFNPNINWPNYPAAMASNKQEVSRKIIQLKAFNGKYVCADENLGERLIANRDSAQGWETFTLIEFEKKEFAIMSHKEKYITAESDKNYELSATRDVISSQSTFSIEMLNANKVAFKTGNGNFVSVDESTLNLYAQSSTAGKNETFEIIYK